MGNVNIYISRVHHIRHYEFAEYGEGLHVRSREMKALEANAVDAHSMCCVFCKIMVKTELLKS